ncbi:MAG: hypothetical protein WC071_08555, partial [Victivallaceae bacterium]
EAKWAALENAAAEKQQFDKMFADICSALSSEDSGFSETLNRTMADNLKTRKMICLELEKFGGIDSETEASVTSLAEELSMAIASNFGSAVETQVITPAKIKELTGRWLQSGIIPPAELEPLYERFEKALDVATAKLQ